MNANRYFTEAERAIHLALHLDDRDGEGFTGWSREDLLAYAQVNATLALRLDR